MTQLNPLRERMRATATADAIVAERHTKGMRNAIDQQDVANKKAQFERDNAFYLSGGRTGFLEGDELLAEIKREALLSPYSQKLQSMKLAYVRGKDMSFADLNKLIEEENKRK